MTQLSNLPIMKLTVEHKCFVNLRQIEHTHTGPHAHVHIHTVTG